MSADPRRLAVLAACCMAVLAAPARAQLGDALGLFDDPLRTRAEAGPDVPPCAPAPPARLPEGELSLAGAVDIALCDSPSLHEAWAAVKAHAAQLGQARAAYLPTVQGTASRLRSVTSDAAAGVTQARTGTTVYASLAWRVLDFGARGATVEAARLDLAAALAARDAAVQATLDAVVQAYFDAAGGRATRDAQEAAAALARSTLESVRRRVAAGAASQDDELQATAALAKSELARTRAQGEFDKAMATLAATLGVEPARAASVPPTPDGDGPDAAGQAKAFDDWLAEASAHHPALVAARTQLASARRSVDVAADEGLPSVDLVADAYRNGYPGQGLQSGRTHVSNVGLSITIPLFDGFARTYKVRAAQAQVQQSQAQLDGARVQVLRDVARAWVDLRSAREGLGHSRLLLDAARGSQASSLRRYERGVADITELLSTQQVLADALRERAQSLSDWRSAQWRLMASAGVLARADLAEGTDAPAAGGMPR